MVYGANFSIFFSLFTEEEQTKFSIQTEYIQEENVVNPSLCKTHFPTNLFCSIPQHTYRKAPCLFLLAKTSDLLPELFHADILL